MNFNMKKLGLIIIICGCFNFVQAQDYKNFTEKEIALIQSDSTQMMRVYKLSNPEDSLVLKSVSIPANPTDKITQLLAKRMLLSVVDPNNSGVGIAAPQVGINRRMMVVQRFDKPERPFEVFINPEIRWASELMQFGPEGDLSFEERGQVGRNYIIEVQYHNTEGEMLTEIIEGFTAVIFQHERDHLDGKLLIDRVKEQKNRQTIPSTENNNLFFWNEN